MGDENLMAKNEPLATLTLTYPNGKDAPLVLTISNGSSMPKQLRVVDAAGKQVATYLGEIGAIPEPRTGSTLQVSSVTDFGV